MNQRDYAALPGVNYSTLKAMAISPLRYRHVLSQPREDSDTFRHGRLGHAAILEPERLLTLPHWSKAKRDARDSEWLAFEAAHEDYTRAEERSHFVAMSLAVRRNPLVAALLQGGVAEQAVTRLDAATGLRLKGRPDYRAGGRLVDLKLTKMTLSRRMLERQIAGLLYHGQAAFYLDLCEAESFTWIFAEQAAPYDSVVVPATPDWIDAGRALYRGWLDRLVECQRTDTWPGLCEGEMVIEVPPWLMPGCDDPGLDMTGLEEA